MKMFLRLTHLVLLVMGFLTSLSTFAQSREVSINIMGPLLIGDPVDPSSPDHNDEWSEFERELIRAKQLGVQSVSTDIWWGLIEPQKGQFDWAYYDRLVQVIERVGLQWMPILSFHQLGGNVGDKGSIPIPRYVWAEGGADTWSENNRRVSSLMFKSELGNYCREYVSFWGTDAMMPNYRRVMEEFQRHFAPKARLISEINVSLGPAGELRYPSYNNHDGNAAGFPYRGALQAYSGPAILSFRTAMMKKYVTIEAVNSAWGFRLAEFNQIHPPNPELLKSQFYGSFEQFTPYGKDFFDWYNESLVQHGKKMIKTAFEVFSGPGSPMKNADLGAKMPGVHWRVANDRLAELSAGLIRTSYNNWFADENAYGYKDTMRVFDEVADKKNFVMHFTAIEMADRDYEGDVKIDSRAESLAAAVGRAARTKNIRLKAENALAGSLYSEDAWWKMNNAIRNFGYSGVTLLRLGDLIGNNVAERSLYQMSRTYPTVLRCEKVFP
ncbi:family 14 glycosylhydrolase [Bdellovibrio sp. HCB337]|uniref:family 14 glycosylhydrolase n=1 Tax=Bdellovibrio sp. HCB337 TaxID=3394358 RepID=UPI0039A67F29